MKIKQIRLKKVEFDSLRLLKAVNFILMFLAMTVLSATAIAQSINSVSGTANCVSPVFDKIGNMYYVNVKTAQIFMQPFYSSSPILIANSSGTAFSLGTGDGGLAIDATFNYPN